MLWFEIFKLSMLDSGRIYHYFYLRCEYGSCKAAAEEQRGPEQSHSLCLFEGRLNAWCFSFKMNISTSF